MVWRVQLRQGLGLGLDLDGELEAELEQGLACAREEFLEGLGLESLAPALEEHGVDNVETLAHMPEDPAYL